MSTESPSGGPEVVLPPEPDLPATVPMQPPPVRLGLSVPAALAGGMLGAAIWTTITALTDYQLGLIAIVIGVLAGYGASMGGRGRPVQVVGGIAAAVSYFVGQIAVVLVLAGSAEGSIELNATNLTMLAVAVVEDTFSSMGVIFLAIAVWEGWSIPRQR